MSSVPSPPMPPFAGVEGLPNFRDIGGYPISGQSGKAVKRDVIFRASEPSQLTGNGIAALRQLGISHVYDLRSLIEIDRSITHEGGRIVEFEGSERVFVPVFLGEDYSPEAIALRYKNFASQGSEVSAPPCSRRLSFHACEITKPQDSS
jgi:hypothetical protein